MEKVRVVKSKCMADMFVWLGFEYEFKDGEYIFKRSSDFDDTWKIVHALKNNINNHKTK